jgi:hypothetical protein
MLSESKKPDLRRGAWAEAGKEQRARTKRRREATGERRAAPGDANRVITWHANLSRPAASTGAISIRWTRLLSHVADVAHFRPLAPGGHDRTYRHAGPRLEICLSRPPHAISTCQIRRLRRCPIFEICCKWMLVLEMLRKSAIFKKKSHEPGGIHIQWLVQAYIYWRDSSLTRNRWGRAASVTVILWWSLFRVKFVPF